jgi:hypothetical protein
LSVFGRITPVGRVARTGVGFAFKASRYLGKALSTAQKTERVANETLKITRKVEEAKQIWTETRNKTPAQNAYKHWKDQGKDFPNVIVRIFLFC